MAPFGGEFEYIDWLRRRTPPDARVLIGPGDDSAAILTDFPTLNPEQLQAVIAFAAASAQEDLPVPSVPRVA